MKTISIILYRQQNAKFNTFAQKNSPLGRHLLLIAQYQLTQLVVLQTKQPFA